MIRTATPISQIKRFKQETTEVIVRRKLRQRYSRHYFGTVVVKSPEKLIDSKGFIAALHEILERENVQCVGEATHDFVNNSFTSVIALAESHISIHTWPERLVIQLDVFLCNYMNNNTKKCERIFDAITAYFEATETNKQFISRL